MKKSKTLARSDQAVGSYLDMLLQEIPAEYPTEADIKPVALEIEADIPVVVTERRKTPVVARQEAATENWRDEHFQSMLFEIGGLTLAIPLLDMGAVVSWPGSMTDIPNTPDWYLGLVRHREQNIRVINTWQIVMDRQKNDEETPDKSSFNHIIMIKGGAWGLACEKIGDVIDLYPGDVKWRTSQGTRPWLAGTVMKYMSALVDTHAISTMLEDISV
ncbi:MAG: chemotaxis protein CheW [Gammaproteobacteria bacterium]|nr:chemotaxis protein CheW [Gammaproteobacteria bacterium]